MKYFTMRFKYFSADSNIFVISLIKINLIYFDLKEAFRIYDKDKAGYISTEALKEILRELDSKLTEDDLSSIIEEVDEDGSGTLDFDEFMEMMTG